MTARCVVFDVDDTLYLERDYVRSGFEAVSAWALAEFGLVDFADRAWRLFEAGARRTIFDQVLCECGTVVAADAVLRMREVYRNHAPQITCLPDAAETLARLPAAVRTAIVTDGPPQSQHAKVEALELKASMDSIVLTGELGEGYGKPHPRGFLLVQQRTLVEAREMVYVADNPAKDFIAPKNLGWLTVRIRRIGGLHHDRQSGRDVDVEIARLTELFDLPCFQD